MAVSLTAKEFQLSVNHRNMNSKEGATCTMQRPKNSQKKEDMT